MRILTEFTTINFKMWHSFMKHLKEQYPDAKFAAFLLVGPGSRDCYDFIAQQTDIKYELLLDWNKEKQQFYSGDIDYDLLRSFELRTPYKSIWRMIAGDRVLGNKYLHDVIWSESYLTENATRENILRYCTASIKKLTELFDNYKPDLYLPAAAMGGVELYITEQICKERNIPVLTPATCRVENIFSFANDKYSHFDLIDKTCQRLLDREITIDQTKAEELYKQLVADFKDSKFFDRSNQCFHLKPLTSIKDKVVFFLNVARNFFGVLKRWVSDRPNRRGNDIRRQPDKLYFLWNNLAFPLVRQFHNYTRLLNPKFGTIPEKGEKYIYYPLHMIPELSTSIQGTMWLDQVHLVEALSKSIPSDWYVYVKEHPATLMYRTRNFTFYNRLLKFPNVRIAPINLNVDALISNAQMVAVITGTSGWEAVMRGVPVINFGDSIYDVLKLSKRCRSLETLPQDIFNEIERAKTIPAEERYRRILCLLTALMEHGFRITYVQQYGYNSPATDEQFNHIGMELAKYLVRHLKAMRLDAYEAGQLLKV